MKHIRRTHDFSMRYYILIIFTLAFVLNSCNSVTERLDSFAVHGIDVSHYQSKINWDTVSPSIDFAFVKATEGVEFNDSLFCYNWDEMKRTQVKRGAYHFFRPTLSPFKQAYNFLHLVELQKGDLPPVLDVEVLDGVSKAQLVHNINIWLNIVENAYGIRPIVYTNLRFYHDHLAHEFDDYPFWIARYSSNHPYLTKGNNWVFWQYGNRGKIKGIDGFVDLNVFKGSLEELDEYGYEPPILYSIR